MTAEYPYREIAPRVYMLNEFDVADCYLLVGEERALLIDTGTGLGDLRTAVRRLAEGRPVDVAATHGHVDHIGGRGQFPRIYVHTQDVAMVNQVNVPYRRAFFALQRQAAAYGVTRRDIQSGLYRTDVLPMQEGQVFRLGGKNVRVFHMPGHTMGSVCLLDEEDGLLFTGDNLNPVLLLCLPNCSTLETWLRSARRVLSLAEQAGAVMYHGHGFCSLTRESAWAQLRHMEAALRQSPGRNACLPQPVISRQDGLFAVYRADKLWD